MSSDKKQKNEEREKEKLPEKDPQKEVKEEKPLVTHHQVLIDGSPLKYSATAGYIYMKDEKGDLKCKIFYVAYEKQGEKDKSKRPVTFTFNGGPGSSSIWLHTGAIGPKRVELTPEGKILPPPVKFIENEYTWLKFTDIVFIDPVGTGYSRAGKQEEEKKFFGVKEDIESVGDFIRLYNTRNHRWLSPQFIAGESYGTLRAGGLSGYLQDAHGIFLSGILLLSSVLEQQTLCFNKGNDLPYWLFFPAYTATAWYYKKLEPTLQNKKLENLLREVEEWTIEKYVVALAKGDDLTDEEKEEVLVKMARYTSLPAEFLRPLNLRLPDGLFMKQLLRDENRTVGRLDSRYVGIDVNPYGNWIEYDPSFSDGPFVAAFNDYVRRELHFESDLPYHSLSSTVNRAWDWYSANEPHQGYANVSETLVKAINRNPYLRVFIGCGYYDLATPYFAAKYTINHLGLDKDLKNNIKVAYYEAGHMMYYHKPSLEKLTGDVKKFYDESIKNH